MKVFDNSMSVREIISIQREWATTLPSVKVKEEVLESKFFLNFDQSQVSHMVSSILPCVFKVRNTQKLGSGVFYQTHNVLVYDALLYK